MKRILVTGGLGFIGSNLVDKLIPNYDVTVLDDFSSGQLRNIRRHLENPSFRLVKGSVLDADIIDDAIRDVDAVVHLAAVVSVVRSIERPRLVHRVNSEGTLNVLESCVKHSVEKVVFASSAAVYGSKLTPPFKEDSPLHPSSLYGASKEAGEAYCQAYSESKGLNSIILRLMNVYGPRASPGPYAGVVRKFAEAISLKKPLVVHGDGEQTRDFTFISDVTDAITKSLSEHRAIGETFNIGTGIPSTINKLASLFASMRGSKSRIIHTPVRSGEVRESYAEIGRAERILGYRPGVSLENGVEVFMKWYYREQETHLEKSLTT